MIPAIEAGWYVDWAPDGSPYLGLQYSVQGISVALVITDQLGADHNLAAFNKAINELKRSKPKLIAVEGSINGGIRPA